ncbi:DUF1206 domain-containing protein [Devosia aurantiaca]|uniref:DUF1206 domain-containing protein n=1 Tax=Devosia aurantiaca TaxID=2714858 RepID=A0A6M1SIA9_9HYPH|nr:DUF1206 domain-containing protein [Devosia aurantiaca]NGP19207.1 DUF1206 domain-containing protein [Devosia aurantiaca]
MGNKFELLARWGYAARGIVYMLLGALAIWGAGSSATTENALSTVLSQPFGRILLGAVAIGLIGHVLWRLAQGVLNADHVKNDAKGIVGRLASIGSAVVNIALAFTAATMALGMGGGGSGSGSSGESEAAASALQLPFGNVLLGLVGVGLIIGGLVQAWRGFSKEYQKRIKLPSAHENVLHPICVFGLAARGLLLAVTGGFMIYAAFTVNPEQAGGLSDALDWIQSLPYGGVLYTLAAVGLIAFGIYSGVQARYRQVDAPDASDIKQTASKIPGVA